MLAERADWFPSFARVGRIATGKPELPIWQSMSRIRQKLDIQYVAQATSNLQLERGILRESKLVGRRRIAALYAMRTIGTSCHTDWRAGPMDGATLVRGRAAQSVCPIHRAISILFEDDAVLFETRTTAALSVRCFKRTSEAPPPHYVK